jgi:hypothetical protein
MSTPRLLLTCIALFWLGSAAATIHNDDATNRAFDALLSMPQAQPPDNNWGVDAPEDYDGSNEDDLIVWLAQQRKQGADLNAYRHYGTLLQHAIRSRMPKVARWLLAHGADPTLKGESGDALSLALQDGQWPLVETMLAMPSFQSRPPQQLTADYLQYAPNALPDMLRHGFVMPSGDTARCILQYALNRGYFELALQIPATRPWSERDAPTTTPQHGCPSASMAPNSAISTGFSKLSPSTLEKLDAKLADPLLPYLLPTLHTAQDVQTLLALPLRKANDPVRLLTFWATGTAPGHKLPWAASETLAQRLPPGALATALADGKALGNWLYQAARSSTKDFAYALEQVPVAALKAHSAEATYAIYGAPGDARQWALLLGRPELELSGADTPQLLLRVPPQLWAQLFAHGYHVAGPHADSPPPGAPDEAIQWLRSTYLEAIHQHWPLLAEHVPGLADRSIPALLYPCLSQGDLARIRELMSLGARVKAEPFPESRKGCTEPATYKELLALGVITRPAANASSRFVYAPMDCQFPADNRWLKTLATRSVGDGSYEDAAITTVQLIDYPGQTTCAILVTSGDGVQEVSIDNGGFSWGPGPEQTPCADPSPRIEEVWRYQEGRLEANDLDAETDGLLPLRDRTTGRRYYLAYRLANGGRCNGPPGQTILLTWSTKPPYRLHEVDPASPALVWLRTQCANTCFDIQGYDNDPYTDAPPQKPRDAARQINEFIDHFFVKQRADWINATLALDSAHLRQLEAVGVPAIWALESIDAITDSKLPLADRRQRTAWLFRDGARLRDAFAQADYEQTRNTIFGLNDWLPREDWRPVLESLRQVSDSGAEDSSYRQLQHLADEAQEQGKLRLTCRLLHADDKPCPVVTSD